MKELRNNGLGLAAISYDSPAQIRYPKICVALRRTQPPECLAIGRFSTDYASDYVWPVLGDYRGCIRRSPECQHGRHGVPQHLFAGPTGPGQIAFLRRVLSRTEYKRQSLFLLNPGNGPAPVAGTKIFERASGRAAFRARTEGTFSPESPSTA